MKNMRKMTGTWLAALALILVFALAACGGGDKSAPTGDAAADAPAQTEDAAAADEATQTDAPAETAEEPATETESEPAAEEPAAPEEESAAGTGDGQAMASLIEWMMGGTFSYDYETTTVGPDGTTSGTGSMAMDGGKMAVTSQMTIEGQATTSKIIILDGATYVVDDASKLILKMSNAGAEVTGGMMTDYSNIEKIGEGEGEIGGKTLPYEEYKEAQTGATVKYYLDGGQVYGIVSEYEGYVSTMIISNPSNSVPAGAFDLPSGYTEMEI